MCIMPLLQLIAPETTPDAGYATFFFSLIVIGLFLIQFAAMYAAGQDKIKAQEENDSAAAGSYGVAGRTATGNSCFPPRFY